MRRNKSYEFHPLAWEEFLSADDWYLSRSTDASIGFIDEVSAAIDNIHKSPLRWQSLCTKLATSS